MGTAARQQDTHLRGQGSLRGLLALLLAALLNVCLHSPFRGKDGAMRLVSLALDILSHDQTLIIATVSTYLEL
jgi:cell division protein FtsB